MAGFNLCEDFLGFAYFLAFFVYGHDLLCFVVRSP